MPDTPAQPPLTIALSKGRILEQTLPLLAAAGIAPAEDVTTTRKLMVDGSLENGDAVRFLIIRAADVCTYVEQGAADLAWPDVIRCSSTGRTSTNRST